MRFIPHPISSEGVFSHVVITDEVEERQRLSYLSQTDDLTGVFNRRAYNDVVLQYEEQYKTNKTDFVLYMIDLDDFKKINDAKIVTKASIGHATYSETNSLLSLIELADKRMYEMKKEHKTKR